MPFYEYECHACGHRLEALQKISDEPLLRCSACGEVGLKKLISRAAFRLKGSGWYETDFKNSDTQSKERQQNGDKKPNGSDPAKSPPPGAGSPDKKDSASKKPSSSAEPVKQSA